MTEYLLVTSSSPVEIKPWQTYPTLEVRFHSDACPIVDFGFRHGIVKVAQWILPSGSVEFIKNVMTQFRTDAWKTELNLFFYKNKTAEIINWVQSSTMKSSQRARSNFFIGRFHTRGRTNRLDGQIVWCASLLAAGVFSKVTRTSLVIGRANGVGRVEMKARQGGMRAAPMSRPILL